MRKIEFLDENGTFTIKRPEDFSGLYFPIAQNMGVKSSVTPNFGGDAKLNQNAFILEPVSVQNLNNNRGVRNFWCKIEGEGIWSAMGASAKQESEKFTDKQDESTMTGDFMCQTVHRYSRKHKIEAQVCIFAPVEHCVEVMYVTIKNMDEKDKNITPTVAIPIFGRSADNIRDHRHVTSLLHRISVRADGIWVKPTLSFDERGHKKNDLTYFVCGSTGNSEKPVSFFPVLDDFIGEGGTLIQPKSVLFDLDGVKPGTKIDGKEAMGGLKFQKITLAPGEEKTYIIVSGASNIKENIETIIEAYNTDSKVNAAKEKVIRYWQRQVNVSYKTADRDFDGFMKWVSFQPFLRRIFGCSFLPHHDYGRGGRGWRDLWQDCLSLLIMDPSGVRQMIVDNYGGVRIDGTNATIIGEKQGEFVADRNGIARVWMDHGVWPFMTTKLYVDQTGDVDVLMEKAPYFKDEQKKRGTGLDCEWDEHYGVRQRDEEGNVYVGTVLEHILLEHLCSFYEVGAHNHIRLRGADWNDALDMAAENGESVAFSCAYAGNMLELARLLSDIASKYGWKELELLEEIGILLGVDKNSFDDVDIKTGILAEFTERCSHNVSGKRITISISDIVDDLEKKAEWMMNHIRNTEWIEGDGEGWFNSYYDNNKKRVEGFFPDSVRMMLTGQVFAVMSGVALDEQVDMVCKSADHYLYREEAGGYRLNTDFKEEKFDLGRMFGFAYGEKENGAVFSHMTVMYANALYRRGFVEEGYKALNTLASTALNFEKSKIYPGIPEYFDADGRGLYHYLTVAASWYMLTFITEVFGVKGQLGNLSINPRLVKKQFDSDCRAELKLNFAGKSFRVIIENTELLNPSEYAIEKAVCDNVPLKISGGIAYLDRNDIEKMDETVHTIKVTLSKTRR